MISHAEHDADTAVDLNEVTVRYGDVHALDSFDLHVRHGESIAVLGPNGAGKTTLLEVIQGFRRPSAGAVRVLGEDPLNPSLAWPSRIGVVLQHWRDHLFWTPREVIDLVAFAHMNLGRGSPEHTDHICHMLEIEPIMDQKIVKLSGGQRRRLDVCLALLGEPEILILDEPTIAFDPAVRREFHEFMRSLRQTTTLLWATHDLHEAEKNCERIVVIREGRRIADSSVEDLRTRVNAGTVIEWVDEQGTAQSTTTSTPNSTLADLATRSGVSNIRVADTSFEDIYLELVGEADHHV